MKASKSKATVKKTTTKKTSRATTTKKTTRKKKTTGTVTGSSRGRKAAAQLKKGSSSAASKPLPSVGRPRSTKKDISGDLTRLKPVQRAVLKAVKSKAKKRSDAARSKLLSRAKDCGFTEKQLDKALRFIRDKAPIVIAFNPDKSLEISTGRWGYPSSRGDLKFPIAVERDDSHVLIDAFIADTEYRNQFETGITEGSDSAYSGGSRDGWERTIFEGGYHKKKKLIPSERPKYGALNAHLAPNGPADSYGECQLILKPGARKRVTFTPDNSSGAKAAQVGTIEDIQHVLVDCDSSLFEQIMEAAVKGHKGSGGYYDYIEAQVHGPVEFGKDFSELKIASRYKGTKYEKKLKAFAKKNGLKVSSC